VIDEVNDHVMLLVQCGFAVTVLCFLKSLATFGVVTEILLERCKYAATPFGMSPMYGASDDEGDDWNYGEGRDMKVPKGKGKTRGGGAGAILCCLNCEFEF
jgi:hypothetical protein